MQFNENNYQSFFYLQPEYISEHCGKYRTGFYVLFQHIALHSLVRLIKHYSIVISYTIDKHNTSITLTLNMLA